MDDWHIITDQDIKNVPKARIFNNKVDLYIQETCRKVLRLSKERNDGYKHDEVVLAIDFNGKELYRKFGANGKIYTDDDEYFECIVCNPENSIIIVHNHPNNSTISFNDIHELMVNASLHVIVAVGNDGRISSVKKRYRHSSFGYFSKINRLSQKCYLDYINHDRNVKYYWKLIDDVRKHIMKNPEAYGLIIKNSFHRR